MNTHICQLLFLAGNRVVSLLFAAIAADANPNPEKHLPVNGTNACFAMISHCWVCNYPSLSVIRSPSCIRLQHTSLVCFDANMNRHKDLINADLQLHDFILMLWRSRCQHCPLACHTVAIAAAWKALSVTRRIIPLQIPAIAKDAAVQTTDSDISSSAAYLPYREASVVSGQFCAPLKIDASSQSSSSAFGSSVKAAVAVNSFFQTHKAERTLLSPLPSCSPPAAVLFSSSSCRGLQQD